MGNNMMLLSIRYILAIYLAYFIKKRRYICPLSHKTTACTLYLVNIDLALKFKKNFNVLPIILFHEAFKV